MLKYAISVLTILFFNFSVFADQGMGGHLCSFVGIDADKKAQVFGDAIFQRSKTIMRAMNIPDFDETSVEVIGSNSQYSTDIDEKYNNKEVVLKFAAKHESYSY